jgi:IS4 transposase
LTPAVFFDLLFYATSLSLNSSLEYLVSYLDNKYGIKIRKQSLDERFSERTVNFVKNVLILLIGEQFSGILYNDKFLSDYEHIRIKDSTKFNVPNNLAAHYKGSGGSGSTSDAGICIQYEFDLKTGKFLDLTITEAVRNDQKDATETVDNLCKNDLVLRDLGYFSTSVLQKISEKEAFYLSKLHSNVLVYDENDDEIDFKMLYTFMTKSGIERLDKQVFIGKDKLATRLVIGLVPPEVYQERLRRKQKEETKKGRQMNDRTRFLLHFNLFVTNIAVEKLPSEKMMPLYRFRWQVELMFKNWKSVFSIHKLQKMKLHRYITMLYIRLILIVVNLQIANQVQNTLSKQKIQDAILSYKKTLQTLKNSFFEILSILRSEKEKAMKLMENIFLMLSENHWREKRKKRENFADNICLFI